MHVIKIQFFKFFSCLISRSVLWVYFNREAKKKFPYFHFTFNKSLNHTKVKYYKVGYFRKYLIYPMTCIRLTNCIPAIKDWYVLNTEEVKSQ